MSEATVVYMRPPAEICTVCGSTLWVTQHENRFVHRLDGVYYLHRQGLRCSIDSCPGRKEVHRVPKDLRIVLPHQSYGTDVVLEVGERHLQHGDSFGRIARDLQGRDVPLSKRNTGRLFRSYVALTEAALGDEGEIREKLRAQGGILLMVDGVQYDNTSPVLYMVWDGLSGTPLFGERKTFRGAEDLVPLLERVKAMDVNVIATVSDKEKGLVPAIAEAFPETPHQLCHNHFLGRSANGMDSVLGKLKTSVDGRATKVQRIAKSLHVRGWDSEESDPSSRLDLEEAADGVGLREAAESAGVDHLAAAHADGPSVADADEPANEPAVEDIDQPAVEDADEPAAEDADEPAVADADGPAVEDTDEAASEDTSTGGSTDLDLISEEQLAVEFCAMARHASRASGRAPFKPQEHVRHQGLEEVRQEVAGAIVDAKKGGSTPDCYSVSIGR